MAQNIVDSYSMANEAGRLMGDNAKRLEFFTTIRVLRDHIRPNSRILDCAAGAGAYALHFADEGHDVVALDLVPYHIRVLKSLLVGKPYEMEIGVNDAVDLSRFGDATFDVVLNMGPFYHLPDADRRRRCLAESVRVTRPGGIVAVSYMSRFAVMPFMAQYATVDLPRSLYEKVIGTGALPANDPDCFWTDSYFATPREMTGAIAEAGLEKVDHFAADGISPLMQYTVNAMGTEPFAKWAEFHYRTCREESLLGVSSHGMIIGKKR